jgi:hypothetical protein
LRFDTTAPDLDGSRASVSFGQNLSGYYSIGVDFSAVVRKFQKPDDRISRLPDFQKSETATTRSFSDLLQGSASSTVVQRQSGLSPCGGRRMTATAAHLVDHVFPRAPARQWVLSLPFALRYRLAYDSEMVTAVLQVFIRALFGLYRRKAREYGSEQTRCGAVTFVQRFGSAANLNLHFHVVSIEIR